jgi:flavodoxin
MEIVKQSRYKNFVRSDDMKRIIVGFCMITAFFLTFSTNGGTAYAAGPSENGKILIAYFTNPEPDGVDAVARASRVVVGGEVLGNTQFIARIIQDEAGGDLFEIKTVKPYPPRPELMELGMTEKRQNARPELSTRIENLEDYNVIFLGYPNWNADLPMAVYTFLEQYDFSGKTIIPFCPHGGSGFSGTIRSIASSQPNATVITNGFTVSRDGVPNSANDVRNWVRSLNIQ